MINYLFTYLFITRAQCYGHTICRLFATLFTFMTFICVYRYLRLLYIVIFILFTDNRLLIVTHWLHTYAVFVLEFICLTAVFRFLLFLFSYQNVQ